MRLIRRCGFGAPNLDRAMRSASNSLAMIVQEQLHPFTREGSAEPKTREIHLHRLPWPLDELEALGDETVEMRVTLSYFIEPNPSARGGRSRYRYESHGLRFDAKRPTDLTMISALGSMQLQETKRKALKQEVRIQIGLSVSRTVTLAPFIPISGEVEQPILPVGVF
jgi:hypothetical protein